MSELDNVTMNPLGYYGLGSVGNFGSYDMYMPSMMGMNMGMNMGMGMSTNPMDTSIMSGMGTTGAGTAGMTGMGGTGGLTNGFTDFTGATGMMGIGGMGMGMFNPLYYMQMQQKAQEMQLRGSGNAHTIMTENEVKANRETDSALIQKMLTNSDVQQGIQNLYAKVKEGDQDGICEEFDKLKQYVFNTYQDELNARGNKTNHTVAATEIIEAVYGQMASAWEGKTVNLREQIVSYGDSAFTNGVLNGFREGTHKRYVDETMNHCFGLSIDQKESKDRMKEAGTYVGKGVSLLEKGAYGSAVGVASYGAAAGVAKFLGKTVGAIPVVGAPLKWLGKIPFNMKGIALVAGLGMLAGIALDAWWQVSDSSSNANA